MAVPFHAGLPTLIGRCEGLILDVRSRPIYDLCGARCALDRVSVRPTGDGLGADIAGAGIAAALAALIW